MNKHEIHQEQEVAAIDVGISQGLDDLQAGNFKSSETVLSRLDHKYRAMSEIQ
jgi:hypothetical protein